MSGIRHLKFLYVNRYEDWVPQEPIVNINEPHFHLQFSTNNVKKRPLFEKTDYEPCKMDCLQQCGWIVSSVPFATSDVAYSVDRNQ